MSRPLRLAGYIAIGILSGLIIAAAAVFLLTRTEWGMERARRFTVSWLADRVDGELRIGRVTGPGLLGGVTIHDFAIIDPRGRPFISADSIRLAYKWRTLVGGEIIVDRATLYAPDIVVEKLPGDTAWNYEYVFPDTTPEQSTSGRNLVMLEDTRIVNGTATVRLPLEPDDIRQPSDTVRLLLERVPGGIARTMRFTQLNGRFDRVIWESPIEDGQLFSARTLSANAYIFRAPVQIRNVRGTLTHRDSVVAFDLPEVELTGSRGAVLGRVTVGADRNRMDIRIDGERVRFRDLQWLYGSLPDEGGGSLVLRIQSQPEGTLWLAQDARLSAPGTRLSGTFGIVTGDTMYFTRVALRASPLDVRLIEQILPGGLPVEGLLVGTVEVRGPLSSLETSGDLRLAGAAAGAGSALSWRGVLDVRDGAVSARSLRADVRRLELALLSAFDPDLRLTGSVAGRVEGSGRLDRLRFTGALEHASMTGGRSTFDGGGTLAGRGRSRRLDMTVHATPVTLHELSTYIPALRGLQGELRGPVHLFGGADDLGFHAQLSSPGGPLTLEGRVRRDAGVRHVTATATARAFHLSGLRPELPSTVVSGRLHADVTGGSLATAAGTLALLLDSATLGRLPSANVALFGRLADGVLAVDSSRIGSSAGYGRVRGSLALVPERDGVLEAGWTSESLTALEPYLFDGSGVADGAEPRIAGRLDATATLSGWLGEPALTVRARGEHLVFGPLRADAMRADLGASALRTPDSQFRLTARADSLTIGSHPVRAAVLEATGRRDSIAVALVGTDARQEKLHARGVIRTEPGDVVVPTSHSTAARRLRVDELRIGGDSPWRLTAPATFLLAGGTARLDSLDMRHATGGRVHAAGRLGWASPGTPESAAVPLDFGVRLSGVPFAELLRALRSREDGAGDIEGTLRVHGTALEPVLEANLATRGVRYGDTRIDRAFAELSYAGRGLDAHIEAQHGGRTILTGGGRVPLDLRLTGVDERRLAEPLRFTITADSLPPALPLSLLRGFASAHGRIDGDVILGGTTLDPALGGGFTITGGTVDWDVSGVRYRHVNGRVALEGGRVLSVDVQGFAEDPHARGVRSLTAPGGGSGRVQGTLDFAELTDPLFDLRFTLERAYAARRRDLEAAVSGEVRLDGRYSRPEVTGALRVDEGTLYLDELWRQYLIVGLELDDPSLLSVVDTSLVAVRPLLAASANPFRRGLLVRNLALDVQAGSWLRSRDMDVEVTGAVTVAFDRQQEDLRLSGSLDVERGTYTLYYPPLQSRRFQVRQGSIEFAGTPGIDPNLAITAAYRARAHGEPLDVLAIVAGTLQSPRIRLSSDAQPPISESDLASYLFFGVPTWEVAGTGAGPADMRAMAGLGFRALGPSVLGYASSGLQTLVQTAGLLDYVGLTAGELAPGEQSTTGLGRVLAGTQLELGRYLSSNLFVGYTQQLGTASYDPAMRMEWRFMPEFSLELFAEDRLARTPGFGVRQERDQRKVYGFLLFREWGF